MGISFKKQKAPQPGRQRLAGSASGRPPGAFSYHTHRYRRAENIGRQRPGQDRPPSRMPQLIRYGKQRFGLLIVTIVAVICLVNMLRLSDNPRIVTVADDSTSVRLFLRDLDVYHQAAARLLGSSVMNGNKITVNTKGIAASLKSQFPELAEVSVALPLASHRPTVYIEPQHPMLILATSADGVFVVGQDGRILLRANQAVDLTALDLPVVTDKSGLRISPQSVALPSSTVRFVVAVNDQLKANNIGIKSMTLPPAASELDVYIAKHSYYVKFNLHSDDIRQQIGTFLAVEQQLSREHKLPASYIDVRVNGRAYYK